jgi:hypothetical protein
MNESLRKKEAELEKQRLEKKKEAEITKGLKLKGFGSLKKKLGEEIRDMVATENIQDYDDEYANVTLLSAESDEDAEMQDRRNMKEAIENAEKSRRFIAQLTARAELGSLPKYI